MLLPTAGSQANAALLRPPSVIPTQCMRRCHSALRVVPLCLSVLLSFSPADLQQSAPANRRRGLLLLLLLSALRIIDHHSNRTSAATGGAAAAAAS